jgi:uncharacterized coiled-coil DUF342 family protein
MALNQAKLQQQKEMDTLRGQHQQALRAVQSDLKLSTETTARRDKEITRLTEDESKFQKDNSQLSKQVGELEAKLQKNNSQLSKQIGELEEAKKKITRLTDEESRLQEEIPQLNEQIGQLQEAKKTDARELEAAKKRANGRLKGSENGRRAAIARMNLRFDLKPDDWKDKDAFNQDLAPLDKYSVETSIVARTMNRLNPLLEVVDRYKEDHDALVAQHDKLIADHQSVQDVRDTLAAKLDALTTAAGMALVKAKLLLGMRRDTILALKSDIILLAKTAKAMQKKYESDNEAFVELAKVLATKLQTASEATKKQAATILLLQQFVSDNADKFQ